MKTLTLARTLALLALAAPAADAAKRQVPQTYATIQAAVDAASPGDTIEIAKGKYDESVQVIGRTGLSFVGKGKKTKWIATSGDALFIDMSSQIVVKRIEFRAEDTGVKAWRSTHVLVDQCRFLDCVYGVSFADVAESTIRKCTFRWSTPHGEAFLRRGITLAQKDNGVCVDSVIAKNDIRGARTGISETAGTLRSTIVKNVIRDGRTGIVSAYFGVVAGNTVRDMDNRGITNLGTTVAVLDNEVRETGQEGIYISYGPDMIVAGNTLQKVGTGIFVGSISTSHVFSNEIEKTTGDGIYVRSDAVSVQLTGNDVTKAGASGVHVEAGGHVLIGNTAFKSGAFDLNDETNAGDIVLVGNEFGTIAP